MRIEQLNHTERYGYVYDALGRRIEKHRLDREGKPCNRTTFLWDRMQMIQESSADKRQSLYLYTDEGSYEPLARIDRNGNQEQHIYYFHTDLNGIPEELTDANGKILWECSFQLWGKRIHEIEHESVEQNLRYQGQYLDRETGLHYNTFRYYDPDIGRFTQPDPIGLLGGFNLYQYAPNGLMWIDPLGLCFSSVKWKKGQSIWKKGKLSEHYNKHVVKQSEFGNISMKQYHEQMEKFLIESSHNFKEAKIGNQLIKFDPNTNRVLIGHAKDREILSFYKAQSNLVKNDPFTDAINDSITENRTFNNGCYL
ncbi:RHS repeat domain-containing protein [Snodgrassella alvi]|uniref:RHS repeat domain-containing protein n=1 Tax=Snodgrassella alvi TaxID=1196083 RepID=UPI00351BF46D